MGIISIVATRSIHTLMNIRCEVVFHLPPCQSLLQIETQDLKLSLGDNGPVSRAARMGEAVSVSPQANGNPSASATQAVLCMPVLGADGLVAGVVQVVRKKKQDEMVFDAG